MPDKTKLNPDVLSAALEGLASQRRRIEDQIAAVKRMLGAGSQPARDSAEAPPRRRKMSAAARKRIAAAQRQRWNAYHKAQASPPPKAKAAQPKRKLSAAGRKRIAEAAKKRWAAYRKSKRPKKSAAKPEQAAEAAAS